MCFSASASFGASVVLTAIGIASVTKAKSPSQRVFASVPLIFAVQQFSEGVVWLALTSAAYASMEKVAAHTFLVFAQIVWPLCIPFAILMLEKDVRRRKVLKVFAGAGVLVASYYAYGQFFYSMHPSAVGHHIAYIQGFPDTYGRIAEVFYAIATLGPTFVSSVKKMWIFGLAILISYIVTAILYVGYILSVWCFFSSLISILVLVIVLGMPKPGSNKVEPSAL